MVVFYLSHPFSGDEEKNRAAAEDPKPWVVELVYVLINHRYEHMLPTIITTNYDGKQLDAEGWDEEARGELHRRVNEKNRARGYF